MPAINEIKWQRRDVLRWARWDRHDPWNAARFVMPNGDMAYIEYIRDAPPHPLYCIIQEPRGDAENPMHPRYRSWRNLDALAAQCVLNFLLTQGGNLDYTDD